MNLFLGTYKELTGSLNFTFNFFTTLTSRSLSVHRVQVRAETPVHSRKGAVTVVTARTVA